MLASIANLKAPLSDPARLFGGNEAGCYFAVGVGLGIAGAAALGTFYAGGIGGALVLSAVLHLAVGACLS